MVQAQAREWLSNDGLKPQKKPITDLDRSHTRWHSSTSLPYNSSKPPRLSWKMILSTLTAVALISAFLRCATSAKSNHDQEAPLERSWAQYSPFFPVAQYIPPPAGCEVTQAIILERHGARFPTAGAAVGIVSAIDKLQRVKVAFRDPKLDFLKTYKYDLGTDDLVPSGAQQSFDAGQVAFNRYAHLISEEKLPFVRASQSQRVILSATNWTAGFRAASKERYNPTLSVTIPEAKGVNNTLDDNNCSAANGSDAQTAQWISVFAPSITRRLNEGAPGANLTDQDIYSLMSLCAFDTVAHSLDGKSLDNQSPFCDLFSRKEFDYFEYVGDLDKYYNTGQVLRIYFLISVFATFL
ncbi:hypothetical protein E1B28_013357 [Marasmius oreades]|uniref:3-phytase n=1 Tax=Marasmius oreades TaxID=181124 RepID=A0A9P7RQD7_9AGAR|nr:uncharacterized protein E1B28_013357 [Marasmius oreades]KAG7087385.1 hypothetical protein E1B28_013357 [Marasmius oreades]